MLWNSISPSEMKWKYLKFRSFFFTNFPEEKIYPQYFEKLYWFTRPTWDTQQWPCLQERLIILAGGKVTRIRESEQHHLNFFMKLKVSYSFFLFKTDDHIKSKSKNNKNINRDTVNNAFLQHSYLLKHTQSFTWFFLIQMSSETCQFWKSAAYGSDSAC